MNPIDRLPDLFWSERAKKQIEAEGPELVQMSEVAYRIGDVAVAGLIYSTFTNPPWFWFGLAEGVTLRDLIDFRRLQENIPVGSLTGVDSEDEVALKFAAFYGFERTGEVRVQDDTAYMIMRKV